MHTLRQRAFGLQESPALVPYLDLLNSKLVWDSRKKAIDTNDYDWGTERLCVQAYFDYSVGDEIHNVYHTNSNSVQYLLNYGFVTEDNMNDYIGLQVTLADDDPLRLTKLYMLRVMPSPGNLNVPCFSHS